MSRAVSPVAGVVTLLGVTVLLSATLLGVTAVDPSVPGPTASLEVNADAATDRIELVHRGGDTLDVSALTWRVSVDGDPLEHQPPVPFFAATGFRAGPNGPFNSASSNQFSAGERATLSVASTNSPEITRGSTVSVTVLHRNTTILDVSTTAT